MRHPSSYNRGKYWPAEIQVPKSAMVVKTEWVQILGLRLFLAY